MRGEPNQEQNKDSNFRSETRRHLNPNMARDQRFKAIKEPHLAPFSSETLNSHLMLGHAGARPRTRTALYSLQEAAARLRFHSCCL